MDVAEAVKDFADIVFTRAPEAGVVLVSMALFLFFWYMYTKDRKVESQVNPVDPYALVKRIDRLDDTMQKTRERLLVHEVRANEEKEHVKSLREELLSRVADLRREIYRAMDNWRKP